MIRSWLTELQDERVEIFVDRARTDEDGQDYYAVEVISKRKGKLNI